MRFYHSWSRAGCRVLNRGASNGGGGLKGKGVYSLPKERGGGGRGQDLSPTLKGLYIVDPYRRSRPHGSKPSWFPTLKETPSNNSQFVLKKTMQHSYWVTYM